MVRSYKFRIYPNKAQIETLKNTLELCRDLYNAALQERRDAWKLNHIKISCYDQINQLPVVKKTNPEYCEIHSQVLCNVLNKLDKAFQFFTQQNGQRKTGFPRFKNSQSFSSFTYPQAYNSSYSLTGNRLRLSKIGVLKIKLSREIQGNVKTVTIKREGLKWFAIFSCDNVPNNPLPKTGCVIGIDAGVENFATLSDGTQIENYRFYESSQKQLRCAQRSVARKKKGSNNRRKATLNLRTIHQKICNRRVDFQHKVSASVVRAYDFIAIEKLSILGMSKGFLAKQIRDAAWADFFNKLRYKAESADKKLIEVNPAFTSQKCSGCSEIVKKDLSVRTHNCSNCGLSLHRDHNAALNILSAGLAELNLTKAVTL